MRIEYHVIRDRYQVNNQISLLMKSLLLVFTLSATAFSTYDPTYGKNLCQLTLASYCNPQKLSNWSCNPCKTSQIKLTNVHEFFNSTGDNLGLIGISNKTIYLVFRGTLPWDIKNWVEDIDFIKTSYPQCNCQVHRGFYNAYLSIQKEVRLKTSDYMNKFGINKIVVTGHSLGGALAVHAALDLSSIKIHVNSLYTFGSPRVGDTTFSKWFDQYTKISNRYRITHGRDPVPHLPPLDFGFLHHPGQIFYISSVKDGFKVCSDSGSAEDPNCSDQYHADVMITDHITYYDLDFTKVTLTCQ